MIDDKSIIDKHLDCWKIISIVNGHLLWCWRPFLDKICSRTLQYYYFISFVDKICSRISPPSSTSTRTNSFIVYNHILRKFTQELVQQFYFTSFLDKIYSRSLLHYSLTPPSDSIYSTQVNLHNHPISPVLNCYYIIIY